jgi:hypothetical protein
MSMTLEYKLFMLPAIYKDMNGKETSLPGSWLLMPVIVDEEFILSQHKVRDDLPSSLQTKCVCLQLSSFLMHMYE